MMKAVTVRKSVRMCREAGEQKSVSWLEFFSNPGGCFHEILIVAAFSILSSLLHEISLLEYLNLV